MAVRSQLRDKTRDHDEGNNSNRDVDEEDPLPSQSVHRDPAQNGTHEYSHAGCRSPKSHGGAPAIRRKIRVMTAMVWGVIMAAPSPWTARAAINMVISPERPHHSEAG